MFAVGDPGRKVYLIPIKIVVSAEQEPSSPFAVSKPEKQPDPSFTERALSLVKRGLENWGNNMARQGEMYADPEFRRGYAQGLAGGAVVGGITLGTFGSATPGAALALTGGIALSSGTGAAGCSCDEAVLAQVRDKDATVNGNGDGPTVNPDASTMVDGGVPDGGAIVCGPNSRTDAGALTVECDRDQDGILNDQDNCPDNWNPRQIDSNKNRVGDPCDPRPNPPGIVYDGFLIATDLSDLSRVAGMRVVDGALMVVLDHPGNGVKQCVDAGGRRQLCSTQGVRIPPDPIQGGGVAFERPKAFFQLGAYIVWIVEATACDPSVNPACYDLYNPDGSLRARLLVTDLDGNDIKNGVVLQSGVREGERTPAEIDLFYSGSSPAGRVSNIFGYGGFAVTGMPGNEIGWLLANVVPNGLNSPLQDALLVPFVIATPGPNGNPAAIDMFYRPPYTRGVRSIALNDARNEDRYATSAQSHNDEIFVLLAGSERPGTPGGASIVRVHQQNGVVERIPLPEGNVLPYARFPEALQLDPLGLMAFVPRDDIPQIAVAHLNRGASTVNMVDLGLPGIVAAKRVVGEFIGQAPYRGGVVLLEAHGARTATSGFAVFFDPTMTEPKCRIPVGIDPERMTHNPVTGELFFKHNGNLLDIQAVRNSTVGQRGRPASDPNERLPMVTKIDPAVACP